MQFQFRPNTYCERWRCYGVVQCLPPSACPCMPVGRVGRRSTHEPVSPPCLLPSAASCLPNPASCLWLMRSPCPALAHALQTGWRLRLGQSSAPARCSSKSASRCGPECACSGPAGRAGGHDSTRHLCCACSAHSHVRLFSFTDPPPTFTYLPRAVPFVSPPAVGPPMLPLVTHHPSPARLHHPSRPPHLPSPHASPLKPVKCSLPKPADRLNP